MSMFCQAQFQIPQCNYLLNNYSVLITCCNAVCCSWCPALLGRGETFEWAGGGTWCMSILRGWALQSTNTFHTMVAISFTSNYLNHWLKSQFKSVTNYKNMHVIFLKKREPSHLYNQ